LSTAIIIVDHGSRRAESNQRLEELVAMFRQRFDYEIVESAHMELAAPSIGDSFDRCVAQGATRVIVNPFFLLPGRHWKHDIPALVAQAAQKHPGIEFLVTAPLELHPLILQIMQDRILDCQNMAAGNSSDCSVCQPTERCAFRSG
jgi:sirohydrochlorin ferrochelatase